MSKVWEEEWWADDLDVLGRHEHETAYPVAEVSGTAIGPARAKLAAAAPEMARLLLAFIDSDNDLTSSHIDHADGKLIRAVLAKAGVEVDAS